MSDDQGLPALGAVMVVACAVLMFATNKFFGQPTFFSPDQHCSGGKDYARGSTPRGSSRSTNRSLDRKRPNGRSVFDGLPEFGVLEVISSFLSPADLVGIASVSTRFCRTSTSEHLWKAHCETLEPGRQFPLGEAWRVEQQRRHGQHRQQEQERHVQCVSSAEHSHRCSSRSERGCCHKRQRRQRWPRRRPRLSSRQAAAEAAVVSSPRVGGDCNESSDLRDSSSDTSASGFEGSTVSRCSSGGRFSREAHENNRNGCEGNEADAVFEQQRIPPLPPAPSSGGGNRSTAGTTGKGERESSQNASYSGACCDHACHYYSWREAFFRAHRTKPRDLLAELSRGDQEQQLPSPLPSPPLPRRQRCVVVVHGNVHDLTEFLPFHPGGALVLEEHASTDATAAFERFFHSREARRMAKRFVVWDGEAVMGRRGTLWKVAQKRHLDSYCSSRRQEGCHEDG